MSPLSRRRLLRTSAVATVFGSAGCLGLSSRSRRAADRQVDHDPTPPTNTWPAAGYDARNTRHSPDASPPRSTPEQGWSTPLPGVTTAVVVGPDRIYASSDEATVAVDRDGTEAWRVGFGGGGLQYVAGRLYVDAGTLVALDAATGEERWRGPARVRGRSLHEAAGTVYVTDGPSVLGLHADSGEQRWQVETARYPEIVADERRVGVVTRDRVRFFDSGESRHGPFRDPAPRNVETLKPTWEHRIAAAALADGSLYLGQSGDSLDGSAATARRYGVGEGERWVEALGRYGFSGLAVDGERVYVAPYRPVSEPSAGSIVALDRETGAEQWRDDGPRLGAPAVADGTVVAGGEPPGSPSAPASWGGTETGDEPGGQRAGEAPRGSGTLRAFDAATGDRLWTLDAGASFGSYPLAFVGERLYYGDADGLHALG